MNGFTWDHVLYRLYDREGVLLYIGRTRSIRRRFRTHAAEQPWWPEVASCRTEFLPSYEALCEAERVVKGRWVLTHGPTGRALAWDTEPRALREIAARVSDLDWSSDDLSVYTVRGRHNVALSAAREAVNTGDAYDEYDED